MRANNFKYLVGMGVKGVWHNRVMSFASFCIIMVSLLILGFATLAVKDINIIVGNVENENMAVVYMLQSATEEQVAKTGEELKAFDKVTEVEHVTKEQAFEIVKKRMENSAENVEDAFGGLDPNEFMPDSFKMRIKDLSTLGEVSEYLGKLENVESVYLPTDFANKLKSVENIVSVVALAIIAALVTVCIVIISNTTRVSIFARSKQISIMKYVGATNSFINVPFFVEGVFIGFIAALVAWGITWAGYNALYTVIVESGNLASLGIYNLVRFSDIKWWVLLAYVCFSILISSLGNIVSLKKHLRV